MGAIRQGGLFSIDVDIVPTKIGEDAHLVLPAATSGEMNLTSMNGERRMRLTERYMDPPGSAKPDCLIAAGLAQALEKSWRAAGKNDIADKFKGYDWKTEEDAFMDGYHQHAAGGEFRDLRAVARDGNQRLSGACRRISRTARSLAPSVSIRMENSERTAKPSSWRPSGAGSKAGKAAGEGKILLPDQ